MMAIQPRGTAHSRAILEVQRYVEDKAIVHGNGVHNIKTLYIVIFYLPSIENIGEYMLFS